jgi:LPS O-antigen subunit length determinant protein (WzzB/FepE family)
MERLQNNVVYTHTSLKANKCKAYAGIISYLSYVVQVVNFWRQTSMDTEELLVHEGSKWQAVERFHARLIHTF